MFRDCGSYHPVNLPIHRVLLVWFLFLMMMMTMLSFMSLRLKAALRSELETAQLTHIREVGQLKHSGLQMADANAEQV